MEEKGMAWSWFTGDESVEEIRRVLFPTKEQEYEALADQFIQTETRMLSE